MYNHKYFYMSRNWSLLFIPWKTGKYAPTARYFHPQPPLGSILYLKENSATSTWPCHSVSSAHAFFHNKEKDCLAIQAGGGGKPSAGINSKQWEKLPDTLFAKLSVFLHSTSRATVSVWSPLLCACSVFFMLLFRFTSFQCCFLWTRKFETNIPSALAVNIVTAFWRELQNNISGSSLLFQLRRKNWTPASLSRSPLCWMKLLGNTQGPKQECTCWAFAYSSKLLLARLSALRRWAASAHSAHILGFLLLPGSVSMAFPPSPPTRIYSKWY